jgi:hypothetical protein
MGIPVTWKTYSGPGGRSLVLVEANIDGMVIAASAPLLSLAFRELTWQAFCSPYIDRVMKAKLLKVVTEGLCTISKAESYG